MFKRFSSRVCSGALCAIAALGALGAASTAHAAPGHDDDRGRFVLSGNVHVGSSCGPSVGPARVIVQHGDSCGCDTCSLEREYKRGYVRGETRGNSAGYREGLIGARFCDTPRDELRDDSRAYRDGYFAAFSKTYRRAYEQGRLERSRSCRPVYRSYRPW
jgi:hypothetical protein